MKNKLTFSLFLMLLILSACFISQAQNSFYERTIGTAGHENNFAFYRTYDNGYILTGATNGSGSGGYDIYFIKLDEAMNIEWAKTYGGLMNDYAEFVQQTPDSGFIISGSTLSFGAGTSDCYIIRTDAQGNILWSKTYGGAVDDKTIKGIVLNDGNFLIPATSFSFGAGNWDMMILKLNPSGDTLWTRIIGLSGYDYATCAQQTSDGNYIICGRTIQPGNIYRDVFLMKMDSTGNLLWMKTYGAFDHEEAMFVRQTNDNGFIITGSMQTSVPGNLEALLMKTDSAGNLQWTKVYGGSELEAAYNVVQLPDSGYAITGFTDSFASLAPRFNFPNHVLGNDSSHVLLIRTDATGDTLWSRAYGGLRGDEAYSLAADSGGFIIGSYSWSFSGTDSSDAYLIRTDSMGVSDCHTKYISPVITAPVFTETTVIPVVTAGISVNNAATITGNYIPAINNPCLVISINESEIIKDEPLIYPNPFSDKIVLQISGIVMLKVNDMAGRVVYEKLSFSPQDNLVIDLKFLEEGMYVLVIQTSEKLFVEKILKLE